MHATMLADTHTQRVLDLASQKGLLRASDLVTIATKVPQAVFCLLTALQFHELTTQLPRQTAP